ncbi:MAG: hypothetical protein QF785_07425 [Phycisphaeraceae bacterium]|jgi:hypothetical protein|nr:hypothetical protein [Phycisphaeraceae bacterium]
MQNMIAGILGIIAMATTLATASHAADYTVHIVEPAVTDHMILPDGPLPPVCRKATAMELAACRGEYEPASFVVTASKPLEAVRIDVEPLSGPGASWPRQAVDVRVVKEYYCKQGPLGLGRAALPTLLVHDETFLAIEPDPTPENPNKMKNVARGQVRDTPGLEPVSIERRKQFWLTVHVPEDAEPGTYRTVVRIVPRNSEASELTLQVQVYPFTLLPPMLEYSIYYPVKLVPEGSQDWRSGKWTGDGGGAFITPEQYIAECRNMLAHGLTNPNIYGGPRPGPDGSLDFGPLAEILDLRESVGMRPKILYLVGHPLQFTDRPLSAQERRLNQDQVRQINDWTRARGYDEVFFMAADEWGGEQLMAERDSMESVREAGGKIFTAVSTDFFELVGDLLDRPVLNAQDAASEPDGHRKPIDQVHRLGNKIFTYMNPPAGVILPELQRRNEGLGLWRLGFDGTMNWAYMHILGGGLVEQPLHYAKVFRVDGGVLDTLHWEGWREGVDDVRYLTTLADALLRARGRFRDDPLISETDEWINKMELATNGGLDAIRREMARRIIALMDLGDNKLAPEETLAGIDRKRVELMVFPEPWRFKMAAEYQGIREKWFDPATDDSQWGPMQVGSEGTQETGGGWGTQPGFGWYRTELPLTAHDARRKFKYLHFGACDEDTWIYLNGRQVFEHSCDTTGLLRRQIWVTPFVAPLTGAEVRGRDLLAVRVYSSTGMGGIWKPVHLILSDQPLSDQQVKALVEVAGQDLEDENK